MNIYEKSSAHQLFSADIHVDLKSDIKLSILVRYEVLSSLSLPSGSSNSELFTFSATHASVLCLASERTCIVIAFIVLSGITLFELIYDKQQ